VTNVASFENSRWKRVKMFRNRRKQHQFLESLPIIIWEISLKMR